MPAGRRLIEDPYARLFLARPLHRTLVGNRHAARLSLRVFDLRFPGFLAIVLLRNRRYEELLARCVAEGVPQVVLLGAGYDTTAWRLDFGGATLFEVDAPPTQELKRRIGDRRGRKQRPCIGVNGI